MGVTHFTVVEYIAFYFIGENMGIGSRIESKTQPSTRIDDSKQAMHIELDIKLAQPLYQLTDLILPATTYSSIADFLAYRKHEHLIFNQWGLTHTHKHQRQTAINFYGAPGTGKTMAAHAIAHELNLPLIMVDYAALESKYVGETSKNITQIFKQAKEHNAIIFFDEADAILSRRVTNMSHATDVSVNQTRSVLLTLMNHHEGLIIFTTNFIENYDPAFMRRILAHIHFELPDLDGRKKLWQQYISPLLPHRTDILLLAEVSNGLSGSDIANCVLKAAMSAARQHCAHVEQYHFQKAIDEVLHSKEANIKKHPENTTTKVEQRIVSEDYVKAQLGSQTVEDLKA